MSFSCIANVLEVGPDAGQEHLVRAQLQIILLFAVIVPLSLETNIVNCRARLHAHHFLFSSVHLAQQPLKPKARTGTK